MGIQYSDGVDIEARILNILQRAPNLDLTSEASIANGDSSWAIRYHLSPQRANLLRHLDFTGLRVLELGAGMGAISRYLAENSEYLNIVEGTEARFYAAKERLRDLNNWEGHIANIQDVAPQSEYDVVCTIGVMEYSELYLTPRAGRTAFDRFLEITKAHLAPGGVLVLAIENQLGLKYWSGAAEDHTGNIADGISGYTRRPTPRTLPRKTLNEVLRRNGFCAVEEYYPFPDYKLPSTVISSELIDHQPALAAELASIRQFESYGGRRVRFFSDVLAVQSLSEAGLLKDFSNSFLSVATLDRDSQAFNTINRARRRGEVAWHYANGRAQPITTVFGEAPTGIWVTKRPLGSGQSSTSESGWVALSEPVMHGVSLRSELIRTAYFEGTAKALNTFRGFLEEAIRAFAHPSGHLAPNSLDAIYQNALIHDSGGYKWFDLEWTNKEPVTSSWFILRNLLVLRGDQEFWLHDKSPYNLKKIYTGLCRDLRVQPNLSTDIRKEAELRGRVSVEKNAERHEKAIRRTLRQPFIGITYPRHTVKEFYLRQIYGIVRRPSASLFLRIPLIAWYALRNRGRQAI